MSGSGPLLLPSTAHFCRFWHRRTGTTAHPVSTGDRTTPWSGVSCLRSRGPPSRGAPGPRSGYGQPGPAPRTTEPAGRGLLSPLLPLLHSPAFLPYGGCKAREPGWTPGLGWETTADQAVAQVVLPTGRGAPKLQAGHKSRRPSLPRCMSPLSSSLSPGRTGPAGPRMAKATESPRTLTPQQQPKALLCSSVGQRAALPRG